MRIRKHVLRHLMLPRPHHLRKRWIPERPDPTTGKYHAIRYRAHPWYMPLQRRSSWWPSTWFADIMGRPQPADHDERYMPEGYLITEVGPKALRDTGREEMDEQKRRIQMLNPRSGCPFAQW